MAEIGGIIVFCLAVVAVAAGLLNRQEHPPDPKEDLAQERYLAEWSRKHGKRTGKDEQETEKEVIQADSRVQSTEENETGGGVRF